MLEIFRSQLLPSGNVFLRVRDSIFIPAVKSNDQTSINLAFSALKNAYDKHRLAVDALATLAISNSKVIESSANTEILSSKITILTLILVALGLTMAGIHFVASRVINQLGAEPDDIHTFASRIAKGNLSSNIVVKDGNQNSVVHAMQSMQNNIKLLIADSEILSQAALAGRLTTHVDATQHQGDFRKVVEGVNATLETIVAPITAVKEAVETIHSATNEISLGNNDLSNRTEQQAANLEETAASMDELASTVKQNSENAKEANRLAQPASEAAIKGGEVVASAVNTMNGINESAHHIENIISMIDGIAFQTNILALNAAVEAARAGEQGRGFAVVAGEVRNLAQRSASAAKEIKELITNSVAKTAEGAQLVGNAGKTMDEVVLSVKYVADIINQIAASSYEQSNGIKQVNVAVVSMGETTQRNAALVEQAAAASESLVEQAEALSKAISVFNLESFDNRNSSKSKFPDNVFEKNYSGTNLRLIAANA